MSHKVKVQWKKIVEASGLPRLFYKGTTLGVYDVEAKRQTTARTKAKKEAEERRQKIDHLAGKIAERWLLDGKILLPTDIDTDLETAMVREAYYTASRVQVEKYGALNAFTIDLVAAWQQFEPTINDVGLAELCGISWENVKECRQIGSGAKLARRGNAQTGEPTTPDGAAASGTTSTGSAGSESPWTNSPSSLSQTPTSTTHSPKAEGGSTAPPTNQEGSASKTSASSATAEGHSPAPSSEDKLAKAVAWVVQVWKDYGRVYSPAIVADNHKLTIAEAERVITDAILEFDTDDGIEAFSEAALEMYLVQRPEITNDEWGKLLSMDFQEVAELRTFEGREATWLGSSVYGRERSSTSAGPVTLRSPVVTSGVSALICRRASWSGRAALPGDCAGACRRPAHSRSPTLVPHRRSRESSPRTSSRGGRGTRCRPGRHLALPGGSNATTGTLR